MKTLKNILNCNRAKLLFYSPGLKLCMWKAWQAVWEEEELGNKHLKNSEGVDLFIHDMNTGGTDEATHPLTVKTTNTDFLMFLYQKVTGVVALSKNTQWKLMHTPKKNEHHNCIDINASFLHELFSSAIEARKYSYIQYMTDYI